MFPHVKKNSSFNTIFVPVNIDYYMSVEEKEILISLNVPVDRFLAAWMYL